MIQSVILFLTGVMNLAPVRGGGVGGSNQQGEKVKEKENLKRII